MFLNDHKSCQKIYIVSLVPETKNTSVRNLKPWFESPFRLKSTWYLFDHEPKAFPMLPIVIRKCIISISEIIHFHITIGNIGKAFFTSSRILDLPLRVIATFVAHQF
jgi:hypothetical protein